MPARRDPNTNEMFIVDEFNQNQLNFHNLVRSQHIGPGNDAEGRPQYALLALDE